eukprot:scaffold685_cov191-Alexandrium_tamarense.AAC.5
MSSSGSASGDSTSASASAYEDTSVSDDEERRYLRPFARTYTGYCANGNPCRYSSNCRWGGCERKAKSKRQPSLPTSRLPKGQVDVSSSNLNCSSLLVSKLIASAIITTAHPALSILAVMETSARVIVSVAACRDGSVCDVWCEDYTSCRYRSGQH